jgi:hypothetical protein
MSICDASLPGNQLDTPQPLRSGQARSNDKDGTVRDLDGIEHASDQSRECVRPGRGTGVADILQGAGVLSGGGHRTCGGECHPQMSFSEQIEDVFLTLLVIVVGCLTRI